MATQQYTIGHTGSVVGDSHVTRSQNQVAPQRETEILELSCPDNFDTIDYVGARDPTRFIPRSMESADITDDDGNGALEDGERTVALSTDFIPVTGEPDVADADYPPVEAVNVTQGTTLDPVDDLTLDYAANEVTVAESAVADGDTVKFYPIITEGTLKFHAINALGQREGAVYPWGFPLYRWHDMPQDKRGTEITLAGRLAFDRNESMQVMIDSPRQVVWEDADHPDAYVSTFEQDVEITF